MDDLSAKPGAPNLYGVTGGDANAICPGKRPLSSMTPTMVFKDGKPFLVLGTPGGPTIFTTVYQVLLNRLEYGMTLKEAVGAPRFHHQWPPQGEDTIWFERQWQGLPPMDTLGYHPEFRRPLGDVQAIEIGDGRVEGVSDPRGRGTVAYE
jgi:gamma-glutamyltranspeptidase/glutathione hydrolase